jgi:predicted HAD superfamily Cof-like phosphohydrolase
MSNDLVKDICDLHVKFSVHSRVQAMTDYQREAFMNFRIEFIKEEVVELSTADSKEDVVDALIDIIVVALGTLDAFAVDINKAWNEVHSKNMQKEPGVNPTRPNDFGFPDMIKPEGWTPPNHEGNTGLL